MIIVIPKIDEESVVENASTYEKKKITSFLDMIKYVYPYLENYLKDITASYTKDYLINKNSLDYNNLKEKDNINIKEVNLVSEGLKEEHFSKNQVKIITIEEKEKMEFGTKIHEKLELIDFNNPDYSMLTDFERIKIEAFINSDIIKNNLDSKFYKEFEFTYLEEDSIKHGIIDLMIENTDTIIIIDYKLKNIEDEAYQKQLLGYKEVISKRSNKKIELYLYSILDEKFECIK
ncbi:MAG: PD-(D/E)XK nuclease family protein [Bacilli bacterium]|nr:PD-(D/E)XK nuclease family protein [Bacilli bacterium]